MFGISVELLVVVLMMDDAVDWVIFSASGMIKCGGGGVRETVV